MLTLLTTTLCWLVALAVDFLILTPFFLRNSVGEVASPQRILNWFCIPAPVLLASLLAAVPSAPFLFLSPLLEVGWCKVARRELFLYLGCFLEWNRLCGSVAFGIGTRRLDVGRSLLALFVVVWPSVIDIVYSWLLPARYLDSNLGLLKLFARAIAVAPSRRLRSCPPCWGAICWSWCGLRVVWWW